MNARKLVLASAALAVAGAVGLNAHVLEDELDGGEAGGPAVIGGTFTLVDHTGRRVSESDFRGKLMLIYFGYTYCPDICPTELAAMSRALDLLGDEASGVTPLFITIDPTRDTVAALADYRQHFHPSLVALTGTKAEIAAVAKAYGVYFAKAAGSKGEHYLVDHSSFVFLMDKVGRYIADFGPNASAEAMAQRIRTAL